MKKITIALFLLLPSILLSSCATECCSDGLGHCCAALNGTCPYKQPDAWWY